MKKLLIIGDSLSMSRHEDGIGYEKMYSSLLALAFPSRLIVNASERANSTKRISSSAYLGEYVYPMKPDVAIIQIGVVDCLPRLLTDFQRRAVSLASRLSLTKGLANRYIEHLSKRRLQATEKRPMSLVSLYDFEENLRLFRSALTAKNSEARFILITIPCPGKAVTEKSYNADNLVVQYNNILRKIFLHGNSKFVDLYEATKCDMSLLLQDGYHISEFGHEYLFRSTRNILNDWAF